MPRITKEEVQDWKQKSEIIKLRSENKLLLSKIEYLEAIIERQKKEIKGYKEIIDNFPA